MWALFGTMWFLAPITHPSSIGLAERYVQLIIGTIRLQCIQHGEEAMSRWGIFVAPAVKKRGMWAADGCFDGGQWIIGQRVGMG